MTDADALSELVRAGLRNPARIVVKVQSKKGKEKETIEERRIPHKSVSTTRFKCRKILGLNLYISFQLAELLCDMQTFREAGSTYEDYQARDYSETIISIHRVFRDWRMRRLFLQSEPCFMHQYNLD